MRHPSFLDFGSPRGMLRRMQHRRRRKAPTPRYTNYDNYLVYELGARRKGRLCPTPASINEVALRLEQDNERGREIASMVKQFSQMINNFRDELTSLRLDEDVTREMADARQLLVQSTNSF